MFVTQFLYISRPKNLFQKSQSHVFQKQQPITPTPPSDKKPDTTTAYTHLYDNQRMIQHQTALGSNNPSFPFKVIDPTKLIYTWN